MTHYVIALDNIAVRADDADYNALLVYGILVNQEMEIRKPQFAKALEDLIVFGTCAMEIQ